MTELIRSLVLCYLALNVVGSMFYTVTADTTRHRLAWIGSMACDALVLVGVWSLR